ncbi:hypothetical protein L1987_53219 [Smallanthus sonchifolius]|uniref:Uncharacterized protein n=1 Tax=Smallanthus sonchifolius TaxID=185202 RepID=A0ACB9EVX3_9ASTR|nr:hypothetical protein L1987_53219 [Smallanthus sonchifolius]
MGTLGNSNINSGLSLSVFESFFLLILSLSVYARSQGSPPYSAFLEPERELHERTRDFRECLKQLCENQIPSHVMSTITHATQFHGLEDEDAPGHVSYHMALERFKALLSQCPQHGLSEPAECEDILRASLKLNSSTHLLGFPFQVLYHPPHLLEGSSYLSRPESILGRFWEQEVQLKRKIEAFGFRVRCNCVLDFQV